jgi:hypothetical protein
MDVLPETLTKKRGPKPIRGDAAFFDTGDRVSLPLYQPLWQTAGAFIVAEELRDSQRAIQAADIRDAARALSGLSESEDAPAS